MPYIVTECDNSGLISKPILAADHDTAVKWLMINVINYLKNHTRLIELFYKKHLPKKNIQADSNLSAITVFQTIFDNHLMKTFWSYVDQVPGFEYKTDYMSAKVFGTFYRTQIHTVTTQKG